MGNYFAKNKCGCIYFAGERSISDLRRLIQHYDQFIYRCSLILVVVLDSFVNTALESWIGKKSGDT